MRINDLIKMGLRNLGRRKARTALTVIGVVIGTISIVVMFSIGIGMNTNFRKSVMEMGSLTKITISEYQDVRDSEGNYVDFKKQTLNKEFVEQLYQIEHVQAVSPVFSPQVEFHAKRYQCNITISAMDSSTFETFGFPKLTYGEYPSPDDDELVVVFGSDVLNNYFYNPNSRFYEPASLDPATVKMTMSLQNYEYKQDPNKKNRPIRVKIAVMEKTNSEFDYQAYVDLEQLEKYYREYIRTLIIKDRKKAEKAMAKYSTVQINCDNVKNVEKVRKEIENMGFQSSSLSMYTKPMEQTSKMLQMVLGGVGAVAMLVSAISIANTMIMSIYERTKEIGVMKVLGCVISDIKKLFLFEAAMIGLIGGIIGIAISYLASYFINKFGGPLFEALMKTGSSMSGQVVVTEFSMIPFWLPFLAAAFAMLVGILSGYYPARRATRISAIEAMKTEG